MSQYHLQFYHVVPAFHHPRDRAMLYPYGAPDQSYTLEHGRLQPFKESARSNCEAFLCIGSNISPIQLLHKFGNKVTIAVQRIWVHDYDVIFCSRLAPYGACPAQLVPSFGARVFLAIAWLDQDLISAMDATEAGGYIREPFEGNFEMINQEKKPDSSLIWYYRGLTDRLTMQGQSIAFQDIICKNRNFIARTNTQILTALYQQAQPEVSFHCFIDSLIADAQLRENMHLILKNFEETKP